jgi:SET domain-containing protein
LIGFKNFIILTYLKGDKYVDNKQYKETLLESFFKKKSKNYDIKKSSIHGNGIFAVKDYKVGDRINLHAVEFENQPHIEMVFTEFGLHLNHSNIPSAETRIEKGSIEGNPTKEYITYAIKPIKSGDEITLDYRKRRELEQPQKGWK